MLVYHAGRPVSLQSSLHNLLCVPFLQNQKQLKHSNFNYKTVNESLSSQSSFAGPVSLLPFDYILFVSIIHVLFQSDVGDTTMKHVSAEEVSKSKFNLSQSSPHTEHSSDSEKHLLSPVTLADRRGNSETCPRMLWYEADCWCVVFSRCSSEELTCSPNCVSDSSCCGSSNSRAVSKGEHELFTF